MTTRERIIFILLTFMILFVGVTIGKYAETEARNQRIEDRIQGAYRQGESAGYERGLNIPRSIGQTQEVLQRLGFYKGRIDSIWGKDTDRAFCDWCAEQYFEKQSPTKSL